MQSHWREYVSEPAQLLLLPPPLVPAPPLGRRGWGPARKKKESRKSYRPRVLLFTFTIGRLLRIDYHGGSGGCRCAGGDGRRPWPDLAGSSSGRCGMGSDGAFRGHCRVRPGNTGLRYSHAASHTLWGLNLTTKKSQKSVP